MYEGGPSVVGFMSTRPYWLVEQFQSQKDITVNRGLSESLEVFSNSLRSVTSLRPPSPFNSQGPIFGLNGDHPVSEQYNLLQWQPSGGAAHHAMEVVIPN